ncbi:hypothetical protein BV22DRAFT_1048412 [Leucogyrophana mollusca]|uniref:Uncharacterized protein n=1 Tax=Leucogyrophana mollusca TaxID=85980 RepID=A0ACB8BCF5_9AGAM|nr:hypothetical protein BV22DRAFT_1048412 [Leucogyrophana mollusca]
MNLKCVWKADSTSVESWTCSYPRPSRLDDMDICVQIKMRARFVPGILHSSAGCSPKRCALGTRWGGTSWAAFGGGACDRGGRVNPIRVKFLFESYTKHQAECQPTPERPPTTTGAPERMPTTAGLREEGGTGRVRVLRLFRKEGTKFKRRTTGYLGREYAHFWEAEAGSPHRSSPTTLLPSRRSDADDKRSAGELFDLSESGNEISVPGQMRCAPSGGVQLEEHALWVGVWRLGERVLEDGIRGDRMCVWGRRQGVDGGEEQKEVAGIVQSDTAYFTSSLPRLANLVLQVYLGLMVRVTWDEFTASSSATSLACVAHG